MKIFISHQEKRLGPYSLEEARDLVYRGTVARSDLAWQDGYARSVPLHNLLQTLPPADSAPDRATQRVAGDPLTRLRDPLENTALTWLYVASIPVWLLMLFWVVFTLGFGLIPLLLCLLALNLGQRWLAAHLKTNAVHVSEMQLPDLHQAVQQCSVRLGIEPPAVYILPQTAGNAFAAKLVGHRSIFLLFDTVDSLIRNGDLPQLTWWAGHELGPYAAGHFDLTRRLARLGSWAFWLSFWYARRREFTCDRIGLFCASSLLASQRALLHATVGGPLADQVNIAEIIAQWNGHREEFFVKYRTLCSAHPHLLTRLEQLAAAAQEFGVANPPTP